MHRKLEYAGLINLHHVLRDKAFSYNLRSYVELGVAKVVRVKG